MERGRGSDKHGPRLDDELQGEFEPEERGEPNVGRVEPHREIEEIPGEDPIAEPPDRDDEDSDDVREDGERRRGR